MSGEVDFSGKYKLEKSEKFDEYLAAKGVGFVGRKMAQAGHPYMEIEHKGENLKIKVYLPIKTFVDVSCKLGEEFETTRMDGAKIKQTYTLEEGKLVGVMKSPDGEEDRSTREFTDDTKDTIVLTMQHNDVVAKRYFKRCQ